MANLDAKGIELKVGDKVKLVDQAHAKRVSFPLQEGTVTTLISRYNTVLVSHPDHRHLTPYGEGWATTPESLEKIES